MKSMTGYGKGEAADEHRKVTVELKAVNNRYLEINTRFSKALNFVDDAVRKAISAVVRRGTVDVMYTYTLTGESDKAVHVDMPLASEYLSAAKSMRDELALADDITVMGILRLPDVLSLTAAEGDRDEITALFVSATQNAAAELDKMRCVEGAGVKADFKKLIGNIVKALTSVVARAPKVVVDYRDKRITELLDGVAPDETRIAMEVAVFADKCDINEEISRLTSHIDQFLAAIESEEPQGRRLDFLSQEMNREINTMGSKANDLELTKLVIEMKNELEKIKEQIRNVE